MDFPYLATQLLRTNIPFEPPRVNETPHSLLERLREKPDHLSWKRLVDLYTPLIERWLKQQGVSPSDVDDFVQEVMGVVVREMGDFRHSKQKGAFRRWLRTITVNRLKGYWRSKPRKVLVEGKSKIDYQLAQLEDPSSELSQLWDKEHDEFVARRLLELLEPEFTASTWQAFRRLVMDEIKPAQVAKELGLTTNAVLIAKSRVLRRLRQEIKGLTG
jgi:RNA polymerase sigma factor (sigma-70 family)